MTLRTYKNWWIGVGFILMGIASNAQEFTPFFQSQGEQSGFKLLWAPENWPADLLGINVKRRARNTSEWVLLNEHPIVPSSNEVMDVNDATSSTDYAAMLRDKYDSLVASKKIPVLTEEEMYEQFLNNPDKIKFLKFLSSVEYDFALILGYAFYDLEPPVAESYTYGIFTVNKNGEESPTPIKSVDWEYGAELIYSLDVQSEIKKIRRKKGLEAIWRVPTANLTKYNIKGFHIYRLDSLGSRERMTESPTRVNMAEEIAPLFYSDSDIDNTKDWSYAAVPVTIFDIEGEPLVADYVGIDFPSNLNYNLSISQSEMEDPGVQLSWTLNPEADMFITQYSILRRQKVTDNPVVIDSMSLGNIRSYTDQSITQSGYYFYKIQFVTSQGEVYQSNEQMVYKQLINRPSKPANLRGKVVKERGSNYISLSWTEVNAADLSGYQLYVDGIMTNNGLARDGSVGIIEQAAYKVPIKARYGKNYHFAVSAINTENVESTLSDTLEIFVPTKDLPQVNIWPISQTENRITLNWTYQDGIEDLEGFRLYQNGELILSERQLGPDTRQWQSGQLVPGKYEYELQAITRYDVTSTKSKPRNFNITE